jgi:hypothetical protein
MHMHTCGTESARMSTLVSRIIMSSISVLVDSFCGDIAGERMADMEQDTLLTDDRLQFQQSELYILHVIAIHNFCCKKLF